MRFNTFLNTHFRGCDQLLEFVDRGRSRTVKVFRIDDEILVGVSDGVEAWVAPVANFERFDLRSIMKVKVVQRGTSSINQPSVLPPQRRRAILRAVLDAHD